MTLLSALDELIVAYKHLQGRHDQATHGVRRGGTDGKKSGGKKRGDAGESLSVNAAMAVGIGKTPAEKTRILKLMGEAAEVRKTLTQSGQDAELTKLVARNGELTESIERSLDEAGGLAQARTMMREQDAIIERISGLREIQRDAGRKLLHVDNPVKIRTNISDEVEQRQEIRKSSKELSNIISNENLNRVIVIENAEDGRSGVRADGVMELSVGAGDAIYAHEVGHILESNDPLVHDLAVAFYERRTAGEQEIPLGGSYDESETSKQDDFGNPYTGKVYTNSDGTIRSTEIISMGLEAYFSDPAGFARDDPEHFDLTYMAVKGIK